MAAAKFVIEQVIFDSKINGLLVVYHETGIDVPAVADITEPNPPSISVPFSSVIMILNVAPVVVDDRTATRSIDPASIFDVVWQIRAFDGADGT